MERLVMLVILFISINTIYAEEVNIPETFTAETSVDEITTYYYAGDKLLASESNNIITYHYQDRLGSDVNSKSLPFGQEIVFNKRFSFTGKELDDELYYFNARYYDSDLGRFTSLDPVQENHPYSYVENNPMNYVDITGMNPNNIVRDEWHPPMAMEGEWYPYVASQKKQKYSDFVENYPTEVGPVNSYVRGKSGEMEVDKVLNPNREIITNGLLGIFFWSQDCADAVLAMHTEYQLANGIDVTLPIYEGNDIAMLKFSEWEGHDSNKGRFDDSFDGFLKYIFTYAGADLIEGITETTTVDELEPGDLIFNADEPKHVREIKRVNEDMNGYKIFDVFDGSATRTVKTYQISESSLRENIRKKLYIIKKGLGTS